MVTLLTGAIIGISLASYLLLVSNQNISTYRSQVWNSAIPVVEAGVEEALTQLEHNDINHLSANHWADLGNGWYSKTRYVDGRSYYDVMIQKVEPPVIVSTGYLPAPLAPFSSFGMIMGQVVSSPAATPYVKRRVRVNTRRRPLFHYAMLAKAGIVLAGNNITTDGFDSTDPLYSTLGQYDPAKIKPSGDVKTISRAAGAIDVGNANITGHVGTGAGGTVSVGANGTVGDLKFVKADTQGIQKGWSSDDVDIQIDDVKEPFESGYSTPSGGMDALGLTNYNYILSGDRTYKSSNLGGKVLVTGNETLWVTDTVSFGSGEFIYIAPGASLKLYVSAPTADISGVVNSDGKATSFQYYGLPANKAINFGGNGAFTGSIYAPQADFIMNGGGANIQDFSGACVVNQVKMNGHFRFHFDEALNTSIFRGYVANSWNELDSNPVIR